MVECQLPKLDVAGSIPVSRSNTPLKYKELRSKKLVAGCRKIDLLRLLPPLSLIVLPGLRWMDSNSQQGFDLPPFLWTHRKVRIVKSFMTRRCRYEKSQEVRLGIQAGGRSSGY